MDIIKKEYKIIEDSEVINGDEFPVYHIMKETFIFGFSFCGEFLNSNPIFSIEEAEDFLTKYK